MTVVHTCGRCDRAPALTRPVQEKGSQADASRASPSTSPTPTHTVNETPAVDADDFIDVIPRFVVLH